MLVLHNFLHAHPALGCEECAQICGWAQGTVHAQPAARQQSFHKDLLMALLGRNSSFSRLLSCSLSEPRSTLIWHSTAKGDWELDLDPGVPDSPGEVVRSCWCTEQGWPGGRGNADPSVNACCAWSMKPPEVWCEPVGCLYVALSLPPPSWLCSAVPHSSTQCFDVWYQHGQRA